MSGLHVKFCGEGEKVGKKYELVSSRYIKMWKPEDLPESYRELVGELDDVDWVALVPHSMKDENLSIFESTAFDSMREPKMFVTSFGIFYVGAHG